MDIRVSDPNDFRTDIGVGGGGASEQKFRLTVTLSSSRSSLTLVHYLNELREDNVGLSYSAKPGYFLGATFKIEANRPIIHRIERFVKTL